MSSRSFDNKIVVGDVRGVLSDLPFQGFDCVITSPPYWKLRRYTDSEQEIGQEYSIQEYLRELAGVFQDTALHMNSKGSIWVNLGDNFEHGSPKLVPWMFAMEMVHRGFILRNVVIWYKPDSMAESTQRRFSQKYEPFFWFTLEDDYYFNFEGAAIPCKMSTVKRLENEFYANKGTDVSRMAGKLGDQSHKIEEYLSRGVNAGDLWPIMCNHEKVEHTAPYPIELLVRPIITTCPPGGLVFDPFMGSGTTAKAVLEVGNKRRYFGVDINEKAVEEANRRVQPLLEQGQLF